MFCVTRSPAEGSPDLATTLGGWYKGVTFEKPLSPEDHVADFSYLAFMGERGNGSWAGGL